MQAPERVRQQLQPCLQARGVFKGLHRRDSPDNLEKGNLRVADGAHRSVLILLSRLEISQVEREAGLLGV